MSLSSPLFIPTILCGGAGARLWPVSRELHPKPFIRLPDGESLLQKTLLRAFSLPESPEIITVTNRDLFFKVEDEYRKIKQNDRAFSFILEPFGRNTAPAIALAALYIIKHYDPQTLMIILPADHLIDDHQSFRQAITEAGSLALSGNLVALGIKPQTPEIGYGYIEMGDHNKIKRFIEKPSLSKAEEYLANKTFLWNSGIFCFTAHSIIAQMELYCAQMLFDVKTTLDASQEVKGKNFFQLKVDAKSFEPVEEISIDYAIFEKTTMACVVAADMQWSDVGSWHALKDLLKPDEAGNRIEGEALLYDVANCYVRSQNRLISAIGVNDLFIIDTDDALLIVDKSRAQDIKHLYQMLKLKGQNVYKHHRTVHRPWGTFTILEEGYRFKIKRLEVKPNASLSLQLHYHRSEHWIVVSGTAKVINGTVERLVNTNESTYIPAGHVHRLENPGVIPLIVIEVQSGEYMGEDDIVRVEDVYDRA